ncbi:O-antigen ligase family protein [Gottfriedia acidiceleris]|uniref:O-antigen ligase family protein n=1 Tax=Gottfriedia acidiceleris TaxID=371036 RepID=UPI003000431A
MIFINTKDIFRRIFIFLYSIISIVDSLNGFILNSTNLPLPVGQMYRGVILIFSIFILVNFFEKKMIKLFLVLLYLIITQMIYFFIHNSINGLLLDLTEILKVILIILTVETYKILNKHNILNKADIIKIFKINLWLFPLTIIIPKILGIGFTVYGNGSGYKGFYDANNDLNIVLLVLLIFSIYYVQQKKLNPFIYGFNIILLLLVILLIGSKSSLVFSILIFVFFIIMDKTSNIIKKIKTLLITTSLLGLTCYFLIKFYFNDLLLMFDKQSYFFDQSIKSGNLASFLFSGRDYLLEYALNVLMNNKYNFIQLFFGIGRYYHGLLLGSVYKIQSYKIIEMDFFDTFFSYGLIGILIIYGYIINIIYKTIKNKNFNPFSLLSIIIIMIFSFLGGHVIYSGLAGSVVALVFCLMIDRNNIIKL